MITIFKKLNLRPQELRFVVIVGLILFVVFNFWLIMPRFKDWSKVNIDIKNARETLKLYETEISKIPSYQERLKALEGMGAAILPEEQANRLLSVIYSQAAQSKVMIASAQPRPKSTTTRTNEFFEEQVVSVTLNPTGNEELVNYLYALGSDNSMIRVQDMSLRPDPSNTKIIGNLTLVASFQKARRTTQPPSGAKTTNQPTLTRKS